MNQCAPKHAMFCVPFTGVENESGRRNMHLQLTTSRTQGGMSRGKKSRKNR